MKNKNLFWETVSYFKYKKEFWLVPIAILLFLCSLPLGFSANYVDNISNSFGTQSGLSGYRVGSIFAVNRNVTFDAVISPSCGASTCTSVYLYRNVSGTITQIGNASIVGGTLANFSSLNINMTTNQIYLITYQIGDAGAVPTKNPASFPYSGTAINITGGWYNNSGSIFYINNQMWGAQNYTFIDTPSNVTNTNFSITVKDFYTTSNITNFSATVNGVTYSTTNGTINTFLLTNATSLYNINVSSNQSQGYFNNSFSNINVSSPYVAYLTKTYLTVVYSGNVTYNLTNYARNLTSNINIANCYENGTILRYINNNNDLNISFVCLANSSAVTSYYQHNTETNTSIYYSVVSTYNFNSRAGNTFSNVSTQYFFFDLYAPVATTNYNLSESFTTSPQVTINLTCSDTLTRFTYRYNLTYNNLLLFNGSKANGTTQTNTTLISQDANTINGACSDFFSTNTTTQTFNAYARSILLYDELYYESFNIASATGGNIGARLWFGDNSSVYDFKANNRNNISVVTNQSKLRLQLNYTNGDEIVRYVDMDLVNDTTIRLCTNRNPTQHFEQLAISATETPIIIKNVYSQCYVAGDYTRFAYQEALSLKYFTANTLYYAYTVENGQQTLLSSIDGSIQSFFNIDTLKFNQNAVELELLNDYISFSKSGSSQVEIYYKNPQNNNDALSVRIYRVDNGTLVFSSSSFTNVSEFTLLFDYSTLHNATNQTNWKMILTATRDSKQYTINKYFNGEGSNGILSSGLVASIIVLMLLFGFTLTSSNYTFGIFGVIIGLVCIILGAVAVSTWYILMLQAMSLVLILYCIILLVSKNYYTVA